MKDVELEEKILVRDAAEITRRIMESWQPSAEAINVNALVEEALRFETLWSHGLAVYNQQTGEVAYSSPRLANILGWSPGEHRRQGMGYLTQVTTAESMQHLGNNLLPELVHFADHKLRETYASSSNSTFYDLDCIHLGTGTVVRAGMRVMVPPSAQFRHPDWLVAVIADHSAFRTGNRLFLHKSAPGFSETLIWENGALADRRTEMFSRHEKTIIAHLRSLSMPEAADLMNISLNTLKTHLKRMCRRTDTRGLTGLLALSEMVGWV